MKSPLLFICLLLAGLAKAERPILTEKQLASPPPRIIRTCCSFGTDMKLIGIPGLKLTEVIGIEELGKHSYLGAEKKTEGNGIIYTKNGGFIDLGHLRDQADWTAYLYNLILATKEKGQLEKVLGHEGGQKNLTLTIPKDLMEADALQLAGKIAYDLSVWHEIATWYGASSIPFVPERFSSFSVEDAYSNLLGVWLGIKAIESDLPYEVAMTRLIEEQFAYLNGMKTREETVASMESVRDIWWTRSKKLPSKKVLLKRQLTVFPSVSPLLINDWEADKTADFSLHVPQLTTNGRYLTQFYQLSFKLNQKVPFRKLFPKRKKRLITQADFPFLISEIKNEIFLAEQKEWMQQERRMAKADQRRLK